MEDKVLPKGSILSVHLAEARNLAPKGRGKNAGFSVPYCMISLAGGSTVKSRAMERTLNPVWNQTFDFIPGKLGDYLYVVIKHKTRAIVGIVDDFLGHVSLPMTEFYGKRTVDKWYTLLKNSPKARVTGEIRLKITLTVPGLKYEEDPAPSGGSRLSKQPTALDLAIEEWVITESLKSGEHSATAEESEDTTPPVPLDEDDKPENGKDDGKGKGKGKEKDGDGSGSDSDTETDNISSESEEDEDDDEWVKREQELKRRRQEEEERQRLAEEAEARRRREAEEEAERAKQEKLRLALQAKRLRKIEKEIHDLKEIYDVATSCVRRLEWVEATRVIDVQLGSSDERCIFLNIHLPVGYPDERPTVELEGSFGDFKEGILKAFLEYGNEYAASRHKGLVDIVNFFVVNYERKFNAGRTLAQSSSGRNLLTASNVNGKALNRSAWLTSSLYVPHNEEEEELVDDADEDAAEGGRPDGDYDDWDNEGYFFVRNKNDPLEMHTKQVQKIFGAYSIHLLRELNEVVMFLEPSFLQEEMALALGILRDRPITVTLTFQEDYLHSDYMPSVKVEQAENPNFRMRPQLMEITYQFLQQYWPLRFDSATILAGIHEKIRPHEIEAEEVVKPPTSSAPSAPSSTPAPSGSVAVILPQPTGPPATLNDALVRNVCTYIITGRSFHTQVWYTCATCKLDSNQGCCASCAKVCHAGHQLISKGSSGFYCDCGDGACPTPCRATWTPPQTDPSKPSSVDAALQQNVCTYSVTGSAHCQQRWFNCITCGLVGNAGCCMACVKVCHAGHELRPQTTSQFYCDCGAGAGKGACKALWKRAQEEEEEEKEAKDVKEPEKQLTPEEIEAEAKNLQERTIAIKKMIASGYDQLAAIYALEHTGNDVEKAIDLLAQCGMRWEDVDGRQSVDNVDKNEKNDDDGDAKNENEDDGAQDKKDVIAAISSYLRSSVFVSQGNEGNKEKGKEKGKEKVLYPHEHGVADQAQVRNNNFLAILMYYLLSRVRNCMNFCVMCDTRLASSGLKPVVCKEDKCVFRYSELGLGVSVFYEMKQDSDYVDLMISMTWAAANSGRKDKILSPFPEEFISDRATKTKDFSDLQNVLSKMPSVDEMLLAASSEKELRKMLEAREPRLYRLLRWILSSNRAHLQKLPPDRQVKDMQTPHQYLLLSNSPEKEARFRSYKQQYPAVWAFHGSAIENWHAILRGGLRNLSNTDLMTCGAAYGAGIYLSPHINTSRDYAGTSTITWPGSRLYNQSLQAVAICEIVKDNTLAGQPNPHYVVPNEDLVTTRFFCVFPSSSNPIPYGLDLSAQLGQWLNQNYPTYGKQHSILS